MFQVFHPFLRDNATKNITSRLGFCLVFLGQCLSTPRRDTLGKSCERLASRNRGRGEGRWEELKLIQIGKQMEMIHLL